MFGKQWHSGGIYKFALKKLYFKLFGDDVKHCFTKTYNYIHIQVIDYNKVYTNKNVFKSIKVSFKSYYLLFFLQIFGIKVYLPIPKQK